MNIENQTFSGNQNGDDVNKSISQNALAQGGGWDRTNSWGMAS